MDVEKIFGNLADNPWQDTGMENKATNKYKINAHSN